MSVWVTIGVAVAIAVAVSVGTGWWRYMFIPFKISPGRMTVKRLGLAVEQPEDIDRVDSILAGFARGFNAMITAPSQRVWRAHCDAQPPRYRPFTEEGVAMGFTLRRLFNYRADEFEGLLVKHAPEFRYLYYVGLGFWSGMRGHSAEKLTQIVDGLDPLHRYLCHDGYGFKHAFFDYPKNPAGLAPLDKLDGYARSAAYQGVGRAMLFLYMSQPETMIERMRGFGDVAPQAAAGVGLAAVFVHTDRLEKARTLAMQMPVEWHDQFHLGMCFALKARSITDRDQFERDMANVDASVREAAMASIRECDRIELLVRNDGLPDGYRRWRDRVTDWMASHIEYPLAAIKQPSAATPSHSTASATRRG